MKYSRTIGFRIFIGFSLLILGILLIAIMANRTVEDIRSGHREVSGNLVPSARQLLNMQHEVDQVATLLESWKAAGQPFPSSLIEEILQQQQAVIPARHQSLLQLARDWRPRDRERYLETYRYLQDSLFTQISFQTRADSVDGQAGSHAGPFLRVENELQSLVETFDRLARQSTQAAEESFLQARTRFMLTWILMILTTIVIGILLFYSLVHPVRQYKTAIQSMAAGALPEGRLREGSDEMGQIGTSLNHLNIRLREISMFLEDIGKGNFQGEFQALGDHDVLGNSLLQLREEMKEAALEEKKRKREDEIRNWSNQGIARFSEILREHPDDPGAFADLLIMELVKYVDASVGGIFLLNRADHPEIQLIASYAYDRVKRLKKTIQMGEGLVGRCVQEGGRIYMTDIPDDYIKVKSGLGEDNPNSLLIIPIRMTEEIIGVIELASLGDFQDYQIEFIERIGGSMASSLYAIRDKILSPEKS